MGVVRDTLDVVRDVSEFDNQISLKGQQFLCLDEYLSVYVTYDNHA